MKKQRFIDKLEVIGTPKEGVRNTMTPLEERDFVTRACQKLQERSGFPVRNLCRLPLLSSSELDT